MIAATLTMLAALAAAPAAPAVRALAHGVHWLPGTFVAGTQPDGNTLILDGKDGLIVFDTGRHAQHAQQIIDYAKQRAMPVAVVVNSHWHLDHVGGNARIRAAYPGVRVYASRAIEDAMHGFLAEYRGQLQAMLAKPGGDAAARSSYRDELALIDAGAALYPDEAVTGSGPRSLAGRSLRIGLERNAVTAGDVWLFDPASRVLAAGDLVTLPAPLLDTACAARWKAALADLDRVDFDRLFPGHGAPMPRAGFTVYRRAFDRLLACAATAQPKQVCVDGWMRDAASLIPVHDRDLARSLLDYYLDSNLRGDATRTKALCAS